MPITEVYALLMLGSFFVLLMAGVPVALTLAVSGFIFGWLGFGSFLFNLLPARVFGTVTNYTLLAIPLFVFMGVMLERSRMAEDLMEVVGRLAGGGLHAHVGGHAAHPQLLGTQRPQQAVDVGRGEGADGGLAQHVLAGQRLEFVDDLVLAAAQVVVELDEELAHVNRCVAGIRPSRADGHVQHGPLQAVEVLAQAQRVREHQALDAVEAVVAHARALGLQLARERTLPRASGVLHVHDDQRGF